MPKAPKTPVSIPIRQAAASLSPGETARYTRKLLESLRKIAVRQDQQVLVHLLELASYQGPVPCRPGRRALRRYSV